MREREREREKEQIYRISTVYREKSHGVHGKNAQHETDARESDQFDRLISGGINCTETWSNSSQ